MIKDSDLKNFIGTTEYHSWSPLFKKVVLTDGAKYVAENGGAQGAYWLMDIVASYQPELLKKHPWSTGFQLWILKNNNGIATVSCYEDSDKEPVITQEIAYTDFDLPELKLYVCYATASLAVIMLPSEY